MNRERSQKIDSVQGWLSPVSDGYGKPGLGIGTIYGLWHFILIVLSDYLIKSLLSIKIIEFCSCETDIATFASRRNSRPIAGYRKCDFLAKID